MFWPIELPIKITFWLMIGLMTVGLVVLVRLKWHPLNAILSSSAFGILLFIPSCMVTSAIVDSVRFGVFNHETAREIGDFRVWRSVPMSATKITVQKYASRHRARNGAGITFASLRQASAISTRICGWRNSQIRLDSSQSPFSRLQYP